MPLDYKSQPNSDEQEAAKYSGYQEASVGFYSSDKKKILIIKLGAMGDVVRTTPILLGLKKKYPESLIYWLTKQESYDLLKNNPLIDKIFIHNPETMLRLMYEKFDIVFNFEIDPPATLLANLSKSEKKYGYFFNEKGMTSCFNKSAEYYLKVAFNDELKTKNRKSYQEMMFETAELSFSNEKNMIELNDEITSLGEDFLVENNLTENDPLLGINVSAGKRWPSKLWSQARLIEFITQVHQRYRILLMGGPEEKESLSELKEKLKRSGIEVIAKNTSESVDEFIGLMNLCSGVITTDTLGLHIALALKKKTIALFFSTLENEIFGENLVKIQSPLNQKYFYSNHYEDELADSISVKQVLEAMNKIGL